MAKKEEITQSLRLQDSPIGSISEDLLQRDNFARLIADAVQAPNDRSANVIGLSGSWGSGKSSVANMAIEMIGTRRMIVRFEPWMVSSREALAREFFTVLGQAILPRSDSAEDKKIRARFYKYVSKTLEVSQVGATSLAAIHPLFGIFGGAAKAISKTLDLSAQGLEIRAEQPSLQVAKQELARDLAHGKKQVLIVIDDIDRLDKDEVRTTFQIIKACADFPNVSYLLLYDREQILHALDGTVNDPSAFLEKIISQPFDLPEATRAQRTKILDEALSELGLHLELSQSGTERLGAIFDQVLLPGLPTLRHIKRFVSTVRSLLPGMIFEGHRNIDPADFLALEFLRQYTPSVYGVLREEVAPNPGGRLVRMVNSEKEKEARERARTEQLDGLQQTLKQLATSALRSFEVSTGRLAHAEHRFNTDYWKPVYLGFSEARATVPQKDWAAFLKIVGTKETLDLWLDLWSDRELRDRWVTAITRRVEEIPKEHFVPLMCGLFRWGENHPYEQSQFFQASNISWHEAVWYCCEAILSIHRPYNLSIEMLREAIVESGSIVAAGCVLGPEADRRERKGWGEWSGDQSLATLVVLLEPTLQAEIESGEIWTRPDPQQSQAVWRYLVGAEAGEKWYDDMLQNPKEYARYLNFSLGSSRHDQNILDWACEPKTLAALRRIDLALLNENGLWARKHLLDSAQRRNRLLDGEEVPLESDASPQVSGD